MPDEKIIHKVYIPLVQRTLARQLQDLISQLTASQKIAAVHILVNHIKITPKLIYLGVIKSTKLDNKLHAVFALAELLPEECLRETAIQLLEESQDDNE